MEKKVIIVCIIVGFLGVLAAALGFAAEAKRVKATQIHYASPSQCIFPSSPAMALGLTAVVVLIIAQTVINLTTEFLCCRREPFQFNSGLTMALVCSTLSWFTFLAAVLLLLIGAALNDKQGEESTYYGNYYCYVVKGGVFAVAAVLSLATVILGILSYIMMESATNIVDRWTPPAAPGQPGIAMGQAQLSQQTGIAMGQAQLPQQTGIAMGQAQLSQQRSQDPVFVTMGQIV